jgi:integrase
VSQIFRRCGCRDENGKQLGALCDKLADPKHGTWSFYLAAGLDPKTGRRRQVRRSGFPTKQAAQKARNEAAVKVDRGTFVAPTRERYGEYLVRWLGHHTTTGRGLRETTAWNYRRYIEQDIATSALGSIPVGEIRRFHITDFVAELVAAGRGATTIRRIMAVVQGSLRSALEDGVVESNFAAGVKLPTVARKEFDAWEPAQVAKFLDVASEHRLGALFELAIFTGLRRGELMGLRWADVDMAKRSIVIRHNRTQTAGGHIVEGAPKTASGRRTVDLGDRAAGALLAWKLRQAQERDAWAEAYSDSGYVFTYEDGRPLIPQYASRLFDKLREKAELPHITFHGQRHEAASLMLEAGEDVFTVSKILGHSSMAVTSDIYGHMIGSASTRAADAAAALVPTKSDGAHTLHTQGEKGEKEEAPEPASSA